MFIETPKIALIGARGIPPRYGGSDTVADELSQKLTQMGFEVYVTCNACRCYEDKYSDVTRIHTRSIEGKTLTIPTINEILHTFHLLFKYPKVGLIYYLLSYGALIAMLPRLLGKKIVVCTDGIEWKRPMTRQQYFSPVWKFVAVLTSWYLHLMEWLSVKVAHVVIADSRAVKTYLEKSYKAKNVVYISYGARELINLDITPLQENEILNNVGLYADEYYLEVARIVAENNIHLAIDGFRKSKSKKKLAVVGNFNLKDGYTKYLIKQKYNDPNIVFLDPIFDKTKIGIIRKNCYGYIHSYSSGGTNPSLLEQMVFRKPIMAYDVAFQREVLHGGGLFFKDGVALASCIEALEAGRVNLKEMADWQTNRIKEEYNWEYVAEKYSILFRDLLRHDK